MDATGPTHRASSRWYGPFSKGGRIVPPASEDLLLGRKLLLLRHNILDFESKGASDAGAVDLIGAQTIGDVPLLDVLPRVAHRAGRVLEQRLLLLRRHQPEQIARLLPVVIVGVMVVVGRLAFKTGLLEQ